MAIVGTNAVPFCIKIVAITLSITLVEHFLPCGLWCQGGYLLSLIIRQVIPQPI